jgi:hypothetical protein
MRLLRRLLPYARILPRARPHTATTEAYRALGVGAMGFAIGVPDQRGGGLA